MLSIPEQYAHDVIDGKIVAGRWVRLACERHFKDLETGHERGLIFNHDEAMKHIQFIERFICHTVGKFAGQKFIPLAWQQFLLWQLFGWHREDGTRRFNYLFLCVGRKNGKSTLLAAIALNYLIFEKEHAAGVYFCATKRDQAKISFDEAARMVKRSPELRSRAKTYVNRIVVNETSSAAHVLSSDRDSLDGLNISFAGVDEYHAHKSDAVFNVLKSGMGSRKNPLHCTITTAGLDKNVPCYSWQKTCQDVLKGLKDDDALFPLLFTLDNDDDWKDQNTWIKANPSLNETISIEYLQKQCVQAINQGGTLEVEFKTKHLNEWVSASRTWIQDEIWSANYDESIDLRGRVCYGGLDLASVSDITSLCLAFPIEDGSIHVRSWHWLPAEQVDHVLNSNAAHIYRQFKKDGNIILTPGNVTDYDSIRRTITGVHFVDGRAAFDENCLMNKYKIKAIGFDRYNSTQIASQLIDDGVKLNPFGQGFVSMSAPTKEFEIKVRTGKLHHNDDPVLRWSLSNVLLRRDPAGNIKVDKEKSNEKVDPIVSAIMAIGEHLTDRSPELNLDDFTILSL